MTNMNNSVQYLYKKVTEFCVTLFHVVVSENWQFNFVNSLREQMNVQVKKIPN